LGINRVYFSTNSSSIRDYVFGRPTRNWARAKHAARGALRQLAWQRIRFRIESLTLQFLRTLSLYDPNRNGSESTASGDESDPDDRPPPDIGNHRVAPHERIFLKLQATYKSGYKDHMVDLLGPADADDVSTRAHAGSFNDNTTVRSRKHSTRPVSSPTNSQTVHLSKQKQRTGSPTISSHSVGSGQQRTSPAPTTSTPATDPTPRVPVQSSIPHLSRNQDARLDSTVTAQLPQSYAPGSVPQRSRPSKPPLLSRPQPHHSRASTSQSQNFRVLQAHERLRRESMAQLPGDPMDIDTQPRSPLTPGAKVVFSQRTNMNYQYQRLQQQYDYQGYNNAARWARARAAQLARRVVAMYGNLNTSTFEMSPYTQGFVPSSVFNDVHPRPPPLLSRAPSGHPHSQLLRSRPTHLRSCPIPAQSREQSELSGGPAAPSRLSSGQPVLPIPMPSVAPPVSVTPTAPPIPMTSDAPPASASLPASSTPTTTGVPSMPAEFATPTLSTAPVVSSTPVAPNIRDPLPPDAISTLI